MVFTVFFCFRTYSQLYKVSPKQCSDSEGKISKSDEGKISKSELSTGDLCFRRLSRAKCSQSVFSKAQPSKVLYLLCF